VLSLSAAILAVLPAIAVAVAVRQAVHRHGGSALALVCWAVALAMVAVATIRYAEDAAQAEDTRRREALIRATGLAADQIPVADLALLARDASDYTNPAYQRVVDALRRIGYRFHDARFVYILERAPDGGLRFVADATPPGEAYPLDGLPDFLAGTAETEVQGPFTDAYGHFVTGHVRLAGTPTDRPATLGIDYDAGAWMEAVNEHRWEQLLLGLASQLLLVLCYLPLHRQAAANRRLRRQGELLEACAQAAEALAGGDDPAAALAPHLAGLGRALDADSATLLALEDGEETQLSGLAGWDRRGVDARSTLAGPLLPALARWPAAFRTGSEIAGPVSAAPPMERQRLAAAGIRSIALVPVHAGGKAWGCLGFTDRQRVRAWDAGDLHALRILADAVGGAIARRRITAELEEARTRAEDAARSKGEFLASMTHEIRTPLNGILGMAGILVDARLPGDLGEHAATIRSSGESLLTIINDILDLAKAESDHIELERTPFSPRTAIEDAALLLAEKAQSKGLDLAVQIDAGVPDRLLGDPGRLRQIALNLIGNAVKFTASGEVVVVFAPVPGRPEWWDLAVRDTGIGMDVATVERLFRPFTQADASTTRRYGGTGLGLAICRRLADLMGGSITVESAPGSGTTMRLRVPLPVVDAETGPHRRRRRGITALAVVPHRATREALVEMLDRAGVPTTAVPSMDDVHTGIFPLLVWDVAAGDADRCLEVAARIQAGRTLCLAPIARRMSAQDQAAFGAAAVLRKPLRRRLLLESVDAEPATGAHPRIQSDPGSQFAGRRILVVDDNPANLRLASIVLEHQGFRVDCAGSGAEAVAAHARMPYDAILMDCLMPEMDGWTAARAIRAQENDGRRIPILAVTANTPADEQERCRAAGMDGVVGKPLRPPELLALLDRLLRPARTLREETVATLGNGDLRAGLNRILTMWDGAIAPPLARIAGGPTGEARLAALRELGSLAGTFGLDALAAAAMNAEGCVDDETRWEEAAARIQAIAERSRARVEQRLG
jgi:signal transduction histidine kinase/CheY-like chemotaxis protein